MLSSMKTVMEEKKSLSYAPYVVKFIVPISFTALGSKERGEGSMKERGGKGGQSR